jgi:hypothetical protein
MDEIKRREQAQAREFPETIALFDRIRAAMAERLFATPLGAAVEREMLYTKVQALDALKGEMVALLNANPEAVDLYLRSVVEGRDAGTQ